MKKILIGISVSALVLVASPVFAMQQHTVYYRPADTTPPTVPTDVSATPIFPTVIHIDWNASTDNVGVAGYNVYRDGVFVGSTSTKTKYNDTGLTPNTTYTYTITAFDAAGNMSAQSTPVSATTPA